MSDKLQQLKKEYEQVKIPEEGLERVKKRMDEAERIKMKKNKMLRFKRIGIAAAAVLAIMVILPNTNASVAQAMEKIPVLGAVFKVVTFRDYEYEDDTHEAKVETPQVIVEEGNSEAVEQINKEISDYTETAIAQFEKEMEESADAHKGLDISYDVITDTQDWFVLQITTLETAASGYETAKYYTIDKTTGEVVQLKDLFHDGADYVTLLSEAVKTSMREQIAADEGKAYFIDSQDMPETDFKEISEDQNFYINADGQLVIAFDEYEVAPGYMGRVEFPITDPQVLENMKK